MKTPPCLLTEPPLPRFYFWIALQSSSVDPPLDKTHLAITYLYVYASQTTRLYWILFYLQPGMRISTEAIIGIVSVFVGLPPVLLIIWNMRLRKRKRSPAGEALRYKSH